LPAGVMTSAPLFSMRSSLPAGSVNRPVTLFSHLAESLTGSQIEWTFFPCHGFLYSAAKPRKQASDAEIPESVGIGPYSDHRNEWHCFPSYGGPTSTTTLPRQPPVASGCHRRRRPHRPRLAEALVIGYRLRARVPTVGAPSSGNAAQIALRSSSAVTTSALMGALHPPNDASRRVLRVFPSEHFLCSSPSPRSASTRTGSANPRITAAT